MKRFLLLALLCAGAARAGETSFSIGGGLAYEAAGVNIAHREGHFETYFGVGLLSFLKGFSGGARWYLGDDGSGFFLALNGAAHADTLRIDEHQATGGRLFWATLTPGWRFAAGNLFAQVALGAGVGYSITFWNTPPNPTKDWIPVPDAMLALGVRF